MKEEPVDILDEQGNKTGQSLLKSETHKKGLWHGGAHIWIYNSKSEVLLQLRSPKKVVRPNIWDVSIAGHIPAGKTPLETVVGEAMEELGIQVDPKELKFIGKGEYQDVMPGNWHHRVHTWVFALKRDDPNLADLKLEKAETSDVRWLAIDQLKQDLDNPAKADQYSPTRVSYNIAIAQIPKLLEAKL